MSVTVRFRRIRPEEGPLEAPRYMSEGASGLDLAAAVVAPLVLAPGDRARVPTGFAIEIPSGFEGQVRPRSGTADKHGLTVLNAPGTIDRDFRGEVQVLLVNLGREAFTVTRGTRIAQLVISPVVQATVEMVDSLGDTARGAGGFGSSGMDSKQEKAGTK